MVEEVSSYRFKSVVCENKIFVSEGGDRISGGDEIVRGRVEGCCRAGIFVVLNGYLFVVLFFF